jgi:dihydrofolate synthase/folylpolyglutamate synthase
MNYKQTLDFLFSSLPMFQRIGDAAIKKDLTNIRYLCQMLGQPQDSFPAIHIAGTNGKGSTSHMMASVFQAAGKKVGLYTSPHYVDFRERIKINGVMIPEAEVIHFVEKYKDQWASIQPSFFEITVAMAFYYFRKKKVDIAIIETGLGGRLDSTNIIMPRMSVITNIGFDHMNMLGNTLPEIASEKAGIIKKRIPVIIGDWRKETALVFKKKAGLEESPIYFASKHLKVEVIKNGLLNAKIRVSTRAGIWMKALLTDMTGPYQQQNVRTVLEAFYQWNRHYPEAQVNDRIIQKGLKEVKTNTNMIGRWMVIRKKPLVIADAAHNHHGMMAMLPGLLAYPARKRHFVLGFVADKDIFKILGLFPGSGHYYWCAPAIPRAKPAEESQLAGQQSGLLGLAFRSVSDAFAQAIKEAGANDLVFVGGSSYVVGDFLASLREGA